jgi:hypothetical protein
MRLITGTGLAVFVAFVVGVSAGVWWLMVGAVIATLVWSVTADRTTRWTARKKWTSR